jgi:predicted amidohydrolase
MSEPSAAQPVLLAAVQDSPPSFDLQGALVALRDLASKAAAKARALHATAPLLIVFPEAFLSAYPRGSTFGAKIGSRTPEGRAWFERYHSSCVPVADTEGPVMSQIRSVARENNATLVVGVVERCDCPETGKRRSEYGSANPGGAGTLYCTSLTISPSGELLVAHRKLMPTGTERLVWGFGDGAGIRVVPTPAGRVGACICWESESSRTFATKPRADMSSRLRPAAPCGALLRGRRAVLRPDGGRQRDVAAVHAGEQRCSASSSRL